MSKKIISSKLPVIALVSFSIAALAAAPVFAHHSFAMFDGQKLTVVKGTLISFTNLNPHAWISVLGSVDKKKPAERWDIEATAPFMLARMGIGKDTLNAGDKVTIAFRPLRDGRHGGSLVFIVTPDGAPHGAKPSDLGLDVETLKP